MIFNVLSSLWIAFVVILCSTSIRVFAESEGTYFDGLLSEIKENFPSSFSSMASQMKWDYQSTVSFEDALGNMKDVDIEELKKKMAESESVTAALASDGTVTENIVKLSTAGSGDPELDFVLKLANFGFRSLQHEKFVSADDSLSSFTDAKFDAEKASSSPKDTEEEDPHRVELILNTKNKKSFWLVFHGSKDLYTGGVGITNAWKVKEANVKGERISMPLPPPPAKFLPVSLTGVRGLLMLVGATFIIIGILILCCNASSDSSRKKKDE